MPPTDPNLARVSVATAIGGPYTLVGYTRNFTLSETTDGGGETDYFGGTLDKAGEPRISASGDLLLDRTDTNGQVVIRNARRDGTQIAIEYAPSGTGSGAVVERFMAHITDFTLTSDVTADWNTASFSARGRQASFTTVTLV